MTHRLLPSILLGCLVLSTLAGRMHADEPLYEWAFDGEHVRGGQVRAAAGGLNAKVAGPVTLTREAPRALQLQGKTQKRHHVAVAEAANPDTMKLPAEAFTVEVWVRVDQPLEWGGFVGVIQDNGDYERGWLLGYRKSSFCLGVSSESRKKLTYLTSPIEFEQGLWYHVVGTYDGTVMKLYVDGEARAQSKHQSGPIAYAPKAPFTIGAYHDDNEMHAMTGAVARVSVFGSALSAEQVRARFALRKAQFPGIEPVKPAVTDWPTYRRDNQRTGQSDEALNVPLRLRWVHQPRRAPEPAWPPPAKQNFWKNKYNLQPRVVYDRAFHVAAVGDRVWFGSSAEDTVTCLDAATGRAVWTFHAEAPVRLAPTVAGDALLFGCDDGRVYCVGAADGKLRWKTRVSPEHRLVPGNERVMSVWPVRTGVLVEGDTAYAGAGLFPSQGSYQAALDVRTGKLLARGAISVSPQGYLERRHGRLYVATGRDPAGAFVAKLSRRGKGVGKEVNTLTEDYPYAFIGAGGLRFAGGDGRVAAFSAAEGDKRWEAKVEGKAYGLAVARGRLLVSTDAGHVYSFEAGGVGDGAAATSGAQVKAAQPEPWRYPSEKLAARYEQAADLIVKQSGADLGYALVLNSGDAHLAQALAQRTRLHVVCVEPDADRAALARVTLARAGLAGRVVVHQHDTTTPLPYTDYLFNLIVSDSLATDGRFIGPLTEAKRVLRPHGGVLVLKLDNDPADGDALVRRGPLAGIGEWSHLYANPANTVCSGDEHVGGEMSLQWFGPPGPRRMLDRHLRSVSPLWKAGRLFVPGNDVVFAVDAYNGTPLWSADVPGYRRMAVFRDTGSMVATDDTLYVAAGGQCIGFDAQTGDRRSTFKAPTGPNGEPRDWGYLAHVDGALIGSACKPNASRREVSRQVIATQTYWDFVPIVGSDELFVMDRRTGDVRWRYASKAGLILNPTVTVADGRVYFIESDNPATLKNPSGRAKMDDLLGKGSRIVALDLLSGSVTWQQPHDFSAIQHNLFLAAAQGKLVAAGSRNSGTNRKTDKVQYDVAAFDAASGKLAWSASQNQGTVINGDHGEQDHHPVIVGEKLYVEPFAYELHTGKPLAGWAWKKSHRRGCGTISASASTFFFRQKHATMFDLATNSYTPVTTTTRPGCWINMIPAGGLLLVPEASSGCTCDFAVQTSLAFLPRAQPAAKASPPAPKP